MTQKSRPFIVRPSFGLAITISFQLAFAQLTFGRESCEFSFEHNHKVIKKLPADKRELVEEVILPRLGKRMVQHADGSKRDIEWNQEEGTLTFKSYGDFPNLVIRWDPKEKTPVIEYSAESENKTSNGKEDNTLFLNTASKVQDYAEDTWKGLIQSWVMGHTMHPFLGDAQGRAERKALGEPEFILKEAQFQTNQKIIEYIEEGKTRLFGVAPTSMGKTVLITSFIDYQLSHAKKKNDLHILMTDQIGLVGQLYTDILNLEKKHDFELIEFRDLTENSIEGLIERVRKSEKPIILATTTETLVRRMGGRDNDSVKKLGERAQAMSEFLASIVYDETHHVGASGAMDAVGSLMLASESKHKSKNNKKSARFLGVSATPLHAEADLEEFIMGRDGKRGGIVYSYFEKEAPDAMDITQIIEQLARSTELAENTPIGDLFLLDNQKLFNDELYEVTEYDGPLGNKAKKVRLNQDSLIKVAQLLRKTFLSTEKSFIDVSNKEDAELVKKIFSQIIPERRFETYYTGKSKEELEEVENGLRGIHPKESPKKPVDVVISIKMLDEGRNFPQLGFYLDLNRSLGIRQFLQRTGRILRMSAGKTSVDLATTMEITAETAVEMVLLIRELRGSRLRGKKRPRGVTGLPYSEDVDLSHINRDEYLDEIEKRALEFFHAKGIDENNVKPIVDRALHFIRKNGHYPRWTRSQVVRGATSQPDKEEKLLGQALVNHLRFFPDEIMDALGEIGRNSIAHSNLYRDRTVKYSTREELRRIRNELGIVDPNIRRVQWKSDPLYSDPAQICEAFNEFYKTFRFMPSMGYRSSKTGFAGEIRQTMTEAQRTHEFRLALSFKEVVWDTVRSLDDAKRVRSMLNEETFSALKEKRRGYFAKDLLMPSEFEMLAEARRTGVDIQSIRRKYYEIATEIMDYYIDVNSQKSYARFFVEGGYHSEFTRDPKNLIQAVKDYFEDFNELPSLKDEKHTEMTGSSVHFASAILSYLEGSRITEIGSFFNSFSKELFQAFARVPEFSSVLFRYLSTELRNGNNIPKKYWDYLEVQTVLDNGAILGNEDNLIHGVTEYYLRKNRFPEGYLNWVSSIENTEHRTRVVFMSCLNISALPQEKLSWFVRLSTLDESKKYVSGFSDLVSRARYRTELIEFFVKKGLLDTNSAERQLKILGVKESRDMSIDFLIAGTNSMSTPEILKLKGKSPFELALSGTALEQAFAFLYEQSIDSIVLNRKIDQNLYDAATEARADPQLGKRDFFEYAYPVELMDASMENTIRYGKRDKATYIKHLNREYQNSHYRYSRLSTRDLEIFAAGVGEEVIALAELSETEVGFLVTGEKGFYQVELTHPLVASTGLLDVTNQYRMIALAQVLKTRYHELGKSFDYKAILLTVMDRLDIGKNIKSVVPDFPKEKRRVVADVEKNVYLNIDLIKSELSEEVVTNFERRAEQERTRQESDQRARAAFIQREREEEEAQRKKEQEARQAKEAAKKVFTTIPEAGSEEEKDFLSRLQKMEEGIRSPDLLMQKMGAEEGFLQWMKLLSKGVSVHPEKVIYLFYKHAGKFPSLAGKALEDKVPPGADSGKVMKAEQMLATQIAVWKMGYLADPKNNFKDFMKHKLDSIRGFTRGGQLSAVKFLEEIDLSNFNHYH